ncbi:MAG: amylo-alpha-1,6-glucosidase [Planctomycetes bacterium]|nr:amylo-alpha-1,6-glucosidase [Planctomycetota bacterium]
MNEQSRILDLPREICADYEQALSREWLETNGLGGFACGTVAGPRTRRYHGLLVPALKPPVERRVLLAALDEELVIKSQPLALSSHEYPGAVHPDGHTRLVGFRLDPWPVWTYEVDGCVVEREFFLVHGTDAAVLRYRLLSGARRAALFLRPFLAFRDFHATTHETDLWDRRARIEQGRVAFRPFASMPALWLGHSNGGYRHEPDWYRNFELRIERERGLDCREDLFKPGALGLELEAGHDAGFIAALKPTDYAEAGDLALRERRRRSLVAGALPGADAVTRRLLLAADAFVVRREWTDKQGKKKDGRSVIAGYPWFGDWGRDTLIALPGLCLEAGRQSDARSILRAYAEFADGGMIPNRFPDEGEQPEFNTIDASLWYFDALYRYYKHSGDAALVRELLPVLEQMVARHVDGTRYGIHADGDGLLTGGEPGVQLTWMDAKVGDWVVTPRMGKPVEINALWYNALRVLADLEKSCGRALESVAYARRADRVQKAFAAAFWNAERNCLFDCIRPDGTPDASLRPNQILAVALPFRMLPAEQERAVVDAVTEKLLTPFGLRSLAPGESEYRGRCTGGPQERDGAYHQGTVWAWLIGPYAQAYANVHAQDPECKAHLREVLAALLRNLDRAGLNQVSEIFDGDAPHQPRGCFAQAWSVAALLQARALT